MYGTNNLESDDRSLDPRIARSELVQTPQERGLDETDTRGIFEAQSILELRPLLAQANEGGGELPTLNA